MKHLLFIIAACLPLMLSCGRQAAYRMPDVTDSLVEEHPDSALALLEGCLFPEQLPADELAEYARLRAKACVWAGKSFAQDTLLELAAGYYASCQDTRRHDECYDGLCQDAMHLAECYGWIGKRYTYKGDNAMALRYYIKAEKSLPDSVDLTTRLNWYGTIARQAAMAHDFKLCQEYAVLLSMYADNTAWQTLGLYMRWIALDGEGKSATEEGRYYRQRIADLSAGLPAADRAHYLRNTVSADMTSGEALQQLREVMALEGESANVMVVMATRFIADRRLDSAAHYVREAERCYREMWTDKGREYVSLRNQIATVKSCLACARGERNFFKGVGNFNDSIFLADIEQRKTWEEQSRIQRVAAARTLFYEQQRRRLQTAITAVAFLIAAAAVATVWYVRRRRRRQEEAEERAETLQRLLDDAQRPAAGGAPRDNAFFKKTLLQQLGIIRMMAAAPTGPNKELLHSMAGMTDGALPSGALLDWNHLYPVIDSLYDGFHRRLVAAYGQLLTEREIQICCLLRADFTTKEISVVTGQSTRTVYQRKSDIRRNLAIGEAGDIVSFIDSTGTAPRDDSRI